MEIDKQISLSLGKEHEHEYEHEHEHEHEYEHEYEHEHEHEHASVSSSFMVTQVTLRALIVLFTVAAICVMATSRASILIFGIKFFAHYYYSSAFRFLLGVDAIVCALVLLSLIAVYVLRHKQSNLNYLYFLFLHDLIVMELMMSACGAATAIGYVGLRGQQQTAWMPICDRFGKFCFRIGVSIGLSFAAFLCLFVLTIMSFNKLKSQATL